MERVPDSAITMPLATDLPRLGRTELGEVSVERWMATVGEAFTERSDRAFVVVFDWDDAQRRVVRHVALAEEGNPLVDFAHLAYFHADRDGIPVDHRTHTPLRAVRALGLLGDFFQVPQYTPTTSPQVGRRYVFVPRSGPAVRGSVVDVSPERVTVRLHGARNDGSDDRLLERHVYTAFYELPAER